MKKKICLIIAALIISCCFPGCSAAQTAENEASRFSAATESAQETETAATPSPATTKATQETESTTVLSPTMTESVRETETAAVSSPAAPADRPSSAGQLRVDGTQLVNQAGEAIQLKGISTHGLAWYPDYVNQDCFNELSKAGANVVRLAMYTEEYGGYCSGGNQDDLKCLIRDGVNYARQADMYVIVDWHILSDGDPTAHQDEAAAFFRELSAEFSKETHVLYEICNEPNGGTNWQQIKTYAETVIPVIRQNAPDAVILIGTPNWCQQVEDAAADPITGYDNLMYTLHFYAGTHKEDLRSHTAAALDRGLPLFVSEFGICDASGNGAIDYEQSAQWMNLLNERGVSCIMWNLSNKNETSSAIKADCSKTSGFTDDDLSAAGLWLKEMLASDGASTTVKAGTDNPTNTVSGTSDHSASVSSTVPDAEGTAAFHTGAFSVTLSCINSWESNGEYFQQYSASVANNGDACSSWEIGLTFSADFELSDSWNGQYTVEGRTLHIRNMDYNGALRNGERAENIGFILHTTDRSIHAEE